MSDQILSAHGMNAASTSGKAVTWILRLEGGLALAGAILGYRALGGHWLLFALLFLAPDLTMVGYLRNPGIGAAVYNAGHTYLFPAALALAGFATGSQAMDLVALIWAAHIGFDRMLGYGLKFPTGFTDTHLGRSGKAIRALPA